MATATKRTWITVALLGAAFVAMAAGTRRRNWRKVLEGAFARGITDEQLEGAEAIARAFDRRGDGDERKLAYIIGTAWHESRLKPLREIRAKQGTEIYQIQEKYWNTGYYGRGFAQLTWRDNYAKMSKVVGIDLVAAPDAALDVAVAADIIVAGMMGGMFTGKALGQYINAQQADYYNARRTLGAIMVAGQDTATMVQGHTLAILNNLSSR